MSLNTRQTACPVCLAAQADELNSISQKQVAVIKQIKEARRTGSLSIKRMSGLIDQLEDLKQLRRRLLDGLAE